MRFPRLAFLGVLTATAVSIGACSNSTETVAASGSSTGNHGTGGTGGGEGTGGQLPGTNGSTSTSTSASASTGGSDLDAGFPSDTYPAAHPAFPQVESFGGPVLHAPKVVPIFFANDDATVTAKVKDFEAKVGATDYWKAATGEYGVGVLTSATPIDSPETMTGAITDAQIQQWLGGKLNADDATFPPTDSNTVYSIHYPADVTITLPDGSQGNATSCQDFGGYHSNFQLDANHGSAQVAYAVIPNCGSFGNLTGIDALTGTESHELIEASTDPYPNEPNPGYGQVDDNHIYWEFVLGGGELADMCAQDPSAFTTFAGLPYTVQRSWSNKAAKAGHDPCQPTDPSQVYFAAIPVMDDTVKLGGGGQAISIKGVKIAVGDSKTIQLDLISDGPTDGPFDVSVQDASFLLGGQPSLDFSLDQSSGLNGQHLNLTITATSKAQFGGSVFFVIASQGGKDNYYLGIVGNQ